MIRSRDPARDVLVLLGSGASPAAISVRDLTKTVLAGDAHHGDHDHQSVLTLLRRLQNDIATWNKKELEKVSYEEIGAVCVSLDKEYGTGRNAAIAPYWKDLASFFGRKAGRTKRALGDDSLAQLIQRAVQWLKCSVAHELERSAPPSGSQTLQDFFRIVSSHATRWSVATLNHDRWIEDAFSKLEEKFYDGFSSTGSVPEFSPDLLRAENERIFLKLHGSVDWRWHPDRDNYVKIAATTDDNDVFRAYQVPELLVGTFNKLEDYSYSIYPYLLAAMDRLLARATVIVVSGYGFGDAGVNTRLFSELRYRRSLRMLIIHRAPGELIEKAPSHAYEQLKRYACSKRISFCKCWFDEVGSESHREQLIRFLTDRDSYSRK